MAGNAVIGALRVVLGADSAALEKGLKDAQGKLGQFGANAGKALAAAGAAMVAGLTGLGVAVRGQLKDFDDLAKTSQKIGVPVEQLSALRYAAELADVSSEALTKGLGKLARSAVDAAQGSTTAVAAYQALGVSFRDSNGQLKSVGDLLPQIADRFASMKDGTAKTALAMQIFGKAGADLIPLLNGGAAGINALTAEAKALGLVIDTQTARAAEEFNDNLTRLHRVFTGLVTQISAQMLPALLQFSKVMIELAKNGDLVKQTADTIVGGFQLVVGETLKAVVTFQRAAAEFQALWKVFTSIGDWSAMKQAWADFRAEGEKTEKAWAGVGETINKFNSDAAAGMKNLSETTKKTFEPNIIKTTKDALDSFIASKQKEIATFQASVSTMGLSNAAQEKAKIIAEALSTATSNHIPITENLRQKIQQLAETWATWNEKANFGKQIFEQTRTPLEQYTAEIERLNLAYNYGKEQSDVYARGVVQAQQKLVQATPAAQALGQSLETAFDKAIQGGAQFKDILRSLLSDLSRALANQAFKALLYGQQGGTSGGLLGSAVSGLGKLFGFASGGSFQVGGSGGIDSQLVAFKASPNERVSVTKPGQDAGGSGGVTVVDQSTNNFNSTISGTDRQWVLSTVKQAVAASEARTQRALVNQRARRG